MNQLLIFGIEWMGVIAVTLLLSLSPAFKKRKPVKFVYPRREGFVALALFALILVVQVLFITQTHQSALPPVTPPVASPRANFVFTPDDLLRQVAVMAGAIAPFLLALAVRRQPLLSVGMARWSLRIGFELGAALAIIAIFLTNRTYSILNGLTSAQGLFLAAMLVVGFVEEFVFRGFIQLRLVGWLGDLWGWLATAALYTLWQLPQKLLVEHAALPDLALHLGTTLIFALLLGWIMRRSGSTLATGLYHAVHNWILVL
jgi:membrane protease YdiL (CAAX protease family)